ERPGELAEAFGGPVEDLRGDAALLEQLLLAEPVAPVHRPPPGRVALAGRLFYTTPWSFSTISDSRSNVKTGKRLAFVGLFFNVTRIQERRESQLGGAVELGKAEPSELVPIPLAAVLLDRFQEDPLAPRKGHQGTSPRRGRASGW